MKNNRGFTLIELMIAVVIVAILAAVAFPTYQDSVRKSRRAEAKTSLLKVAQILERCFTEFNRYDFFDAVNPNDDCPTLTAGPTININTNIAPLDGQGYYNITTNPGAETLTATSYTLTATPRATGGQNQDTQCATYTLDNTGVKTAVDNGGGNTRAICWQ